LQTSAFAQSRLRPAAFVAAIVFSACTAAPPGAGTSAAPTGNATASAAASHKTGALLTITIGVDPNHVDPSLINSGQGSNIASYMAETLTTFWHTGKLQGLLATSWQPSTDLTQWTFTLRSGVKFHDGTPFNATAVKKSIERLLDPKLAVVTSNDVGLFVGGVDVVDDTHVTFRLKQPVHYFPEALANETSAITSPQSWTATGNTYEQAENVVGTGPYKLVEYVKGDHVTVVRNTEYWGEKPYYERQTFKVIPDAAGRETAVRSGQVDVATLTPAPDIDSLKADSSLQVMLPVGGRNVYMAINTTSTTQPLLQNPIVRQALNYAIDKDAIVKNVLFGAGQPVSSAIGSNAFGYCKQGPYPYDPEKSKQLLQQAGAAGMTVSMISPTGRYLQDIQAAQAIAGYLTAVGIKVNGPATADSAAYQGMVSAPPATSKTELFIWSFAPDFPHASQQLGRLLITNSIPPKPGINYSHYSNSTVDSLVAKAAQDAPNSQQAVDDYCAAQKQIWSDAPFIFLWEQALPTIVSAKVLNVQVAPNAIVNAVYAEPK
jgi:peptide/nickel transport system substrate-binding protein